MAIANSSSTENLGLLKWSLDKDTVNEENAKNNSNLDKIDKAVTDANTKIDNEITNRTNVDDTINQEINTINDKIVAIEQGSPVTDAEIKVARHGEVDLSTSINKAGLKVAFVNPTKDDNDYSFWLNANTDEFFILESDDVGNASWIPLNLKTISSDMIGDLQDLKTASKTNLVSAINELFRNQSETDKDVLELKMKEALREKEDSTGVTGLRLTEIFDKRSDFILISGYYDEQGQTVRIL